MAWGYWSASTVSDRGRSPRRAQNGPNTNHYYHYLAQHHNYDENRPIYVHNHATTQKSTLPDNGTTGTEYEEMPPHPPALSSRRSSADLSLLDSGGGSSDSPASTIVQNTGILDHENNDTDKGGGGTTVTYLVGGGGGVSAANTFSRLVGNRQTPELEVPPPISGGGKGYYYPYGQPPPSQDGGGYATITYVEYHPPQQQMKKLSFSDEDSGSEPGYATVFPNVPPQPGMPCQGEDRSIYRRGARRWRKLYRVNGHIFQAKRFNRRAFCAFCNDRIWGLGRQGFKCTQCKLLVHKKCHKLVQIPCTIDHLEHAHHQTKDDLTGPSNGSSTLLQSELISTGHAHHHRRHHIKPPPHPNQLANHYHADGGAIVPDVVGAGESVPVEDGAGQGADDLEPGTQRQYSLNDFELIRVIGRGSYAKVLMVELRRTKRIYAMKVIKKALVTDDEDIDWVQTEKHVFETASNHPFLVGLHSCFQTPSRLFFVIEFVRGGDLMFHMQRQRRLPEEHARFYAAEICLALNFLHCKGIIYRDLKLDNVLLDHEGHIKLTDYGMCKEGIRRDDTTSTFCGTPNYIAPEILRGDDYGFSVDWWALGVLLYEMLAGRSPFDIAGASENPDQNTEDYLFQVILEKTIRIPRSLSVKAANVLKGFLNKNPTDRLGCNSARSDPFLEITEHSFFKSIDWDMLEQKQVPPPYKPRLDSDRDLANFPPEFTDEPVHLTPDDPHVIEKIDQSEFEGFEYVNPLLMSLEDCV